MPITEHTSLPAAILRTIKFLELAVNGKRGSDGQRRRRVAGPESPFRDMPIVTPAAFVQGVAQKQQ
jgi:hypothetical protein